MLRLQFDWRLRSFNHCLFRETNNFCLYAAYPVTEDETDLLVEESVIKTLPFSHLFAISLCSPFDWTSTDLKIACNIRRRLVTISKSSLWNMGMKSLNLYPYLCTLVHALWRPLQWQPCISWSYTEWLLIFNLWMLSFSIT